MKSLRYVGFGIGALTAAVAPLTYAAQAASPAALRQQIQQTLSVAEYTLQRIELPAEVGQGFATRVVIAGQSQILTARPQSVRGMDYQVFVDVGADQLETIEAPAPATFAGSLAGDPGSRAAGTLVDGQLQGLIWTSDGTTWGIQPLTQVDPTADTTMYVVYDANDSLPGDWQCLELDPPVPEQHGEVTLGTGVRWCELAFDADVEFFNKNGGSVANTINDIELIVSLMNVIYDRDVDVLFDVATIVVRTAEPDPYSSTDPNTLLNQFRSHWANTKSFIKRDTAHLMTGKNMNGSVIGIAYLSVICSQAQGFGVSESKFSGNLNYRVGLTSHEIGHNYSANHCDSHGSQCFIMCSAIGGCGGNVTKFGTFEIAEIYPYAQSRGCTPELAPPLTFPFFDSFEGAIVDNAFWPSLQGALVTTAATGEPNGTQSLNLDSVNGEDFGDDYVRSNYINMAGLSGKKISLYTEHVGVEAGEYLIVEFMGVSGDWQTAITVTSDGVNQGVFEFHSFDLPANAYHSGFRIGIRVNGDTSDDDWYIDSVRVEDGCPTPVNYCSTSSNSVGSGAIMYWQGSTLISANNLLISASVCPPGQNGIFFYGPNQTQVPFGNGFMCVAGGVTRLPVQTIDAFGEAALAFDVTGTGISAGSTENFQFWYRDPMGGGSAFNLSDGLATIWCP
jgi:hypothetical protein